MATSTGVRVPEAAVESSASAVHWGAIIAGAIGAVGISFILISLGGALGHAAVSPWSPSGTAPTTFGRVAAIWLIVTQWLASGLGGYLAGRMREKWVGIRTDEVVFRDTAHGFLAWALAALIVITLLTLGSLAAGAAAAPTSTGAVSPEAAEAARKAAAGFAFYSSLSLLIGAFIASVAGALGGFHRDEM
jgi:hypothetical protein